MNDRCPIKRSQPHESRTQTFRRQIKTVLHCLIGLLALALFLISSSGHAQSSPPNTCPIPLVGAPPCGFPDSPGSTPAPPTVPHHVGNPINVVSGNKYQFELDYRSFASGLALARHYNSGLTQYDNGLGPGWRHTYQVLLTRTGDNQLNIVQSDGRLIRFYKTSSQNNSNSNSNSNSNNNNSNSNSNNTSPASKFLAQNPEDGYLEVGERSIWHLGDGRRMVFSGSYLVLIDMGDHRGSLTLHYKNRKLHTVTDQRGDALTFNYVPGTTSLPEYGSNSVAQPPGSIASVQLPGGQRITFEYGRVRNLIGVQYPDNDSVSYGYSNEDWPNHLTLRQSTSEDRISEWQYDDIGQAIKWIEGGGINGLEIAHIDPSALTIELDSPSPEQSSDPAAKSGAVVTFADGRQTQYVWRDSQDAVGVDPVYDIACDNCTPGLFVESAPMEPVVRTDGGEDGASASASADQDTRRQGTRSKPLDNAITIVWDNLQRNSKLYGPGASVPGNGTDVFKSEYPHELGNLPLQITTNRVGEVVDIKVSGVSLLNTGRRTLLETTPACFSGTALDNPHSFSHDRIQALAAGAAPCNLDGMVYAELVYKLESHAKAEPTPDNSGLSSRKLPWWNPMRRYCGLPGGKTCEDLANDLDMAELSRCAYGIVSCEPEFELVPYDDAQFGLSADRFNVDGFSAQLYRDAREDRYVLVFRGTDDISDWGDNILQAGGLGSVQYELAISLADDINNELMRSELVMAGHSLGGGLATAAALATDNQATIFNAASLQPGTAENYGLQDEYAVADQYINHIHTRSDPVNLLQDSTHNANFLAVQSTPGIRTVIPNPDHAWMNETHERTPTFWPIIWHSMDAVIHVLESQIEYNCQP